MFTHQWQRPHMWVTWGSAFFLNPKMTAPADRNPLFFFLHSPGKTNGLKGAPSSSPSSSSTSSLCCAPPPIPPASSLPRSSSWGCRSPSPIVLSAPELSSPAAPPSSGPTRAWISLCLCGPQKKLWTKKWKTRTDYNLIRPHTKNMKGTRGLRSFDRKHEWHVPMQMSRRHGYNAITASVQSKRY